jgi:hypothetical protein
MATVNAKSSTRITIALMEIQYLLRSLFQKYLMATKEKAVTNIESMMMGMIKGTDTSVK